MTWEVFLTPHTDDETIGMAGAITRARDHGRSTLVILVTDNLPSTRGARLFPAEDTVLQRRKEWERALHVLRVTKHDTWNIEEAAMAAHPFTAQSLIERNLATLADRYPISAYHTVWGTEDIHADAGHGSLAHGICANALSRFKRTNPDITAILHAVYLYSKPMAERYAPSVFQLTSHERTRKRAAMQCYKWSDQSIGYGYKSVPELFDNAEADPREFLMECL